MMNFPSTTKYEPKCVATYGVMGHLDPKQPPTKRKPFAAILKHNFVCKVELILPQELYELINQTSFTAISSPKYSRVILPLAALVEGNFFTEYVKKGNVLMLSEGKMGIGNVYSLKDGILTLHLDKESYERAGLVGKPDGDKGKRGNKPRWVVEIDLRQPSMLHGKKGFDRIVYAFKNVLTTPVTWLFHDLGTDSLMPDPLDAHFPTKKTAIPEVHRDIEVSRPTLQPPTEADPNYDNDFDDYAMEMHEWLSLVMLNSPRIRPDDRIDPVLSRYAIPGDSATSCKVVKVVWEGFLAPTWSHKMFVDMVLSVPQDAWFAYCVSGFEGGPSGQSKDCTILKLPNALNEYVLWEIE